MAKQNNNQISWNFPEFEKPDRGRRWWATFIILATLAFIYAIFTANFLFALIILIISGIIIYRHYNEPEELTCTITEEGIEIDNRFYPWVELESFWLAFEPPAVKKLYLQFKATLRPNLAIPLGRQNPLQVRKLLSQFLRENLDKEGEPTTDALGRLLKL